MDRGIKIAILAACLLSLGFGLVWDKVIDRARQVIKPEANGQVIGPTEATLKVGDMSLDAPAPVAPSPTLISAGGNQSNGKSTASTTPNAQPTTTGAATAKDGETPYHIQRWIEDGLIKDGKYQVQRGDFPGKLATNELRFRYLKKTEKDWLAANPQFKNMDEFASKLIAGSWLNIPK